MSVSPGEVKLESDTMQILFTALQKDDAIITEKRFSGNKAIAQAGKVGV